jgi:hypothetical protein
VERATYGYKKRSSQKRPFIFLILGSHVYPTQKGGADKKPSPHEECRARIDYGEEVHRLVKYLSQRRGGYLREEAAGMANK